LPKPPKKKKSEADKTKKVELSKPVQKEREQKPVEHEERREKREREHREEVRQKVCFRENKLYEKKISFSRVMRGTFLFICQGTLTRM